MPYSSNSYSQPSGSIPRTDAQLLQAAHRLVEIYLMHLRQNQTGSDVHDTRELPASKDALVNAFRIVIATEARPNVRSLLLRAGLTLAQFQDDVGMPLTIRPAAKPAHEQDADQRATARPSDSASSCDTGKIRQFDRALLRLSEDRTRLGDVFQEAVRIAEKRPHHHA